MQKPQHFGKRSFSFNALEKWNSLPHDVRYFFQEGIEKPSVPSTFQCLIFHVDPHSVLSRRWLKWLREPLLVCLWWMFGYMDFFCCFLARCVRTFCASYRAISVYIRLLYYYYYYSYYYYYYQRPYKVFATTTKDCTIRVFATTNNNNTVRHIN